MASLPLVVIASVRSRLLLQGANDESPIHVPADPACPGARRAVVDRDVRHGRGRAKLQDYMWLCGEKKEMCWWHKAVVAPPKGWI
jgi:hypothetical protein